MSANLRVGVIGVGRLGSLHARHLAGFDGVTLSGVYDIDPRRSAVVAREVGTTSSSDLDALLAKCDAVTVAVPTSVHAEVGLRALGAGKPVLMEKPLAATLGEADALCALAERQGRQLQVGHVERFNQAIRAARPHFGDLRYFECTRLAPFQSRGTDVAVVLDMMIHDLDLILHLTGGTPVTEVRASGVAVLSPHEDVATARVEFADGAVASVTASRIARTRVRALRMFQTDGYFSLDLLHGRGEFMRLRPETRFEQPARMEDAVEIVELSTPPADALALELGSFVHAVRGDQGVVATGREGRAALALALRVSEAIGASPAVAV